MFGFQESQEHDLRSAQNVTVPIGTKSEYFRNAIGGHSIVIRRILVFCNASHLGYWPTKGGNIDV